ncbi:MAG: prolipoprotein diacylglyceryl transferase [Nocardioidaceae bacterium]
MLPLSIPSPGQGVWHLGPLPIRAYALCILVGIFVAIWLGDRRWQARGGDAGEVSAIALWAVPFGIVGGRLYWVLTESNRYFGAGKDPWGALRIWEGGLGIWGAIPLGALGVFLGARRWRLRVVPMADALAPAVLLAQAIGRWGNYFNQELFGTPTTLPWALRIDPEHRPEGYESFATFHPAFLYECAWNLAAFALLVTLDRRLRFRHGQMVALYVLAYATGRMWIENLRIDPIHFADVAGLRLIVWVAMGAALASGVAFVALRRRYGDADDEIHLPGHVSPDGPAAGSAGSAPVNEDEGPVVEA